MVGRTATGRDNMGTNIVKNYEGQEVAEGHDRPFQQEKSHTKKKENWNILTCYTKVEKRIYENKHT